MENTPAEHQDGDVGPEITKPEVKHALKSMKNKKSAGPDEIPKFKSRSPTFSDDSGKPASSSLDPHQGQFFTTVQLKRKPDESLGIILATGNSDLDSCPSIASFRPGSVASNCDQLMPGDKIYSVNGITTSRMRPDEVSTLLDNIDGNAILDIEYSLPNYASQNSLCVSSKIAEVTIERIDGSLGITLRGGLVPDHANSSRPLIITQVRQNGAAHRTGLIRVGDRLLKVDNHSLINKTLLEAQQILKENTHGIILTTLTIEYDVSIMESVKYATGPLLLEIDRQVEEDFGLVLTNSCDMNPDDIIAAGYYIDSITPASTADRCGALSIGDQILAIDDIFLDNWGGSIREAERLLRMATKLQVIPAHVRQRSASRSLYGIPELPNNYEDCVVYEGTEVLPLPFRTLFSPRDELILELVSGEIFRGEVVDTGKDRIDITKMVRIDIENRVGGILSFYRNEIAKVYLKREKNEPASKSEQMKPDMDKEEVESASKLKQIKCDEQEKNEGASGFKHLKLTKEEYLRLKNLIKHHIFIENLCLQNPTYCDAIKRLSSAQNIGVSAPGILKREPFIPILALSTKKQIFILDTSKLVPKNFAPKLKEIFESQDICKVIHKGAPLVDILKRYFGVSLYNIFDTEIVDMIIQKNIKPSKEISYARNVFECLEAYLNFPKTLNENFKVKPEKWAKRPVKDSKKIHASELVVYLIILKETFNEILFKGLYNTVDSFRAYYTDLFKSPYSFSEHSVLEKVPPDMEALIDTASGLSLS